MRRPSLGMSMAWLALLLLYIPDSAPGQPMVRIGVVVDGPWDRNRGIMQVFRDEILVLTRGEFDVRFPEEKYIEGDWTTEGIRAAIDRVLDDPEVDLVLAMGIIAGDTLGRHRGLPKPAIAPFVIDARVQGLPRDNGSSGVHNLNYLTGTVTTERALDLLRQIIPFRHLVVLNTRDFYETVPELRPRIMDLMKRFESELTVIPVGPSVEPVLGAIPEEAAAVLVYPLLRLSSSELDRLIQGLIERRLPSLAIYFSREYVERGVLAGITEDPISRRARRVALYVQRILLGEDAGTLAVDFPDREALVFNMATARRIDVYPSFALETVGELMNEMRQDVERRVDLGSAMKEAMETNLDLQVIERAVAVGAEEIPIANSARLPQLDLSMAGRIIDEDRAVATFQPERVFLPSLTLTQVIFSEPVNANVTVQRLLQDARGHDRNRLRLDVAQSAATAYLNVLRAKARETIQKNNLELTRSHLELARVRLSIGAAGPSEVYRWESEVAANRREVIDAIAERNLAEISLDRILHRPLEEPFATRETDVSDPALAYVWDEFRPYLYNRWYFSHFRDFMVAEALQNAPELLALDAAIAAQERSFTASRRSFFAPLLVFQGAIDRPFRGGASSSGGAIPPDLLPGLTLEPPNELDWTLALDLSFPLFTSGERPAVRTQNFEELSRLRYEREATAERIELRMRSALHLAGASLAGIRLAEQAAEAAKNNLELVTDSYSRGAVSILDLLDAQNAALVADEAAANAVYDFLIDWMETERSAGRFYFLEDREERQRLFERADRFYRERGQAPPGRVGRQP